MSHQEEAYWKAQIACIAVLQKIGINYQLVDRIEPMKVFRIINRFWAKPSGDAYSRDIYKACEQAVTFLVSLRRAGLEPLHKNGKYIKSGE